MWESSSFQKSLNLKGMMGEVGGWSKELFYKFSWILGKNHQWILKPLGDKLMGNYKMEGSDFLHESHWSRHL